MTTPTGTITMLDVIEELDGAPTPRQISLNDADVRELAGIPTGQISMDDLRGKSSSTAVLSVEFVVKGYGNPATTVGINFDDMDYTVLKAEGVYAGLTNFRAQKDVTNGTDSLKFEVLAVVAGNTPESGIEALRGSAVTEVIVDGEPPRTIYNWFTGITATQVYPTSQSVPASTALTTADIGKTCVINIYPAVDVLIASWDLQPAQPPPYNLIGWGDGWQSFPIGSITNFQTLNGSAATRCAASYCYVDNDQFLRATTIELGTSSDMSNKTYLVAHAGWSQITTLDEVTFDGTNTRMYGQYRDQLIDDTDPRSLIVWYWNWQKSPPP